MFVFVLPNKAEASLFCVSVLHLLAHHVLSPSPVLQRFGLPYLRNRFVKVCAVIVSIFCLRILSAECTREGFDSALWGMQVYINDQLVGLYNLMEAPDQGKPQTSLVFTNLNRAAY